MACTRLAVRRGHQLLKNAAFRNGMTVGSTSTAQRGQLLLQCEHAGEASAYTHQMRRHQLVDIAAILARPVEECQQALHVRQRYIERPAMTHEGKPFEMGRAIAAVSVRLALGPWQHPAFFVEANGLHVDTRRPRQLTDPHADSPVLVHMDMVRA